MSSPKEPNSPKSPPTNGDDVPEELAEARFVLVGDGDEPVAVTYEDRGNNPVPVTSRGGSAPFPVAVQGPISANVTLRSPEAPNIDEDPSLILNVIIRNRAEAISFNRYKEFIDRVLCAPETSPPGGSGDNPTVVAALRAGLPPVSTKLSNVYAYELLKSATDAFLLVEAGLVPKTTLASPPNASNIVVEGRRDPVTGVPSTTDIPGITGARLGRTLSADDIRNFLSGYLGSRGLPYVELISATLAAQTNLGEADSPFCVGVLPSRLEPSFIELIWSYWHEEGMLVQTLNAISLRFQNKRSGQGRDPLAHLELDPLRPLNNILWGYIQDEPNRLTIARRAYEYQHEYGLSIYGRAVPKLLPADRRSLFIEAFHNLLHLSSIFFKEQADTMVIADVFPMLNSLKEVHLILAEGAHNQFGDLPWTARVEMLIQKWLLGRPEMREFLGGRIMVPYQEPWMGIVDGMKALQGWGDVSVRYFRDLAVFGEQLLLSIRYGNWSEISDEQAARNWANYWRFAIQGYIHSYRAVTGVDLGNAREAERLTADSYVQPSVHLRKRLASQRRPQLTE